MSDDRAGSRVAAVLEGLARVCHEVGFGEGAARMLELEAMLRHRYSAPQTVKDTEEATGAIAAMRRDISVSAAFDYNSDLDWTAAIKEARELMEGLPQIARAQGYHNDD